MFIIPVEQQDGDVYGTNPSDAKDDANEDRRENKRKGPGYLVRSMKVPETTLKQEGNQMCINTQDHENIDLKPATSSLDIKTSSLEHDLQPGLQREFVPEPEPSTV